VTENAYPVRGELVEPYERGKVSTCGVANHKAGQNAAAFRMRALRMSRKRNLDGSTLDTAFLGW